MSQHCYTSLIRPDVMEAFLYIVNILINVLSEEKVMGCYGVRLG